MKLFPAKCLERATLRKPWRHTGNSSLLPAKCWPLLHVITGISVRFSNFAFVVFCYITNHLMTGSLGNSEFCFPRISMFPSTSSRETLRISGNKIHCSPRDKSLSVSCILWPVSLVVLFHVDVWADRVKLVHRVQLASTVLWQFSFSLWLLTSPRESYINVQNVQPSPQSPPVRYTHHWHHFSSTTRSKLSVSLLSTEQTRTGVLSVKI